MSGSAPTRLAELLAGLSLATDLGIGAPLETSLRTCALATHLGARAGLRGAALSVVYYASLLRHLGCTAWSHEAAALVGDDHDLIQTFEDVDTDRRTQLARRSVRLARGESLARRVRAVARVAAHPTANAQLVAAQCAQAVAFATDLGLPEGVCVALAQMYERHDGRGAPHGLQGDALALAGQLVQAAQVFEALHRRHGLDASVVELRRRRGGQLAPVVGDLVVAEATALAALLEAPSLDPRCHPVAQPAGSKPRPAMWEHVLASEPAPHVALAPARLADAALAFARFADLKSPFTIGHSTQVAALVERAAASWPSEERESLRLAALFHDLGAVSVGNQIWDHHGALGTAAWEQVRLHAYYTERILARATPTLPLAAIAGAHHERLDGSGYHRGTRSEGLGRAARLLAAADAFVAMGERRPHRAALSPAARVRAIEADATAGRLGRDAVALVLAAAGHEPRAIVLPAGLTAREAEVLGLLARGLATKEIAQSLGIAPRTVKHHIEHVYDKTGVSSRAAAALFAARHDLLPEDLHRPFGP